MKLAGIALAALCVCTALQAQKKKVPDVQILECKARRSESKISIDARLRVTSEKPLKGLTLAFHFLDSNGSLLTTEKAEASDDLLDPGEESAFHAETANPPGAIRYKIEASDGSGRDLRLGNAGPFTIE